MRDQQVPLCWSSAGTVHTVIVELCGTVSLERHSASVKGVAGAAILDFCSCNTHPMRRATSVDVATNTPSKRTRHAGALAADSAYPAGPAANSYVCVLCWCAALTLPPPLTSVLCRYIL